MLSPDPALSGTAKHNTQRIRVGLFSRHIVWISRWKWNERLNGGDLPGGFWNAERLVR
jgi:hypothetical protein